MYFYVVESLKKTGYILIALVYLFLSTGIALIKTNCLCSENTIISLYDISDSESEILSDQNCCEETFPKDENNKGIEYSSCGCSIPIVTYLKLNNHPGSETKLEYPVGKILFIVYSSVEILLNLENLSSDVEKYPIYSPPEKPYGRILISLLNQRKIALTA